MKLLRHAIGLFRERLSATLFGSAALWLLERIADKFIEQGLHMLGLF
jgi:hypothetical protein